MKRGRTLKVPESPDGPSAPPMIKDKHGNLTFLGVNYR